MFRTLLSGTARRRRTRRPATRLLIQTLEAREVPAGFDAGNLVLYRVGDGTATLASSGNAVFLDEYTPAGVFVRSHALPTADPDGGGPQRPLIAGGTATAEGYLSRSTDGEYLVMMGYGRDLLPTGGTLSSSPPATAPRVVGVVAANGTIDTTTALTNVNATSPRSAVSTNGTDIWIATQTDGVKYTTRGSTTATGTLQIGTNTTMRTVNIFGGQLYATHNDAGDTNRIGPIGTGLPTTIGQTYSGLPGDPVNAGSTIGSTSPYAFFMADTDASVPGLDTLYVANDDAAAIKKYTLSGGTWTAKWTFGVDNDYRGLTGVVDGGQVDLYLTRIVSGSSEFVKLVDAGGFNGTTAPADVAFAIPAGANKVFRGVAFTPEHANTAPVNTLPATFTTAEDTAKVLTGLSVADDAGDLPVQVTLSISSGTLSVNTGVANGLTAAQVATNGTGEVVLTAPPAAINTTLADAAGVTFTPAANAFGDVSLTMTADDQGNFHNIGSAAPLTDTKTATITVTGVIDDPTITDALTDEDVQTTGGLVFTRNAADGDEVTHVKVTAVTGGLVYLNDGVTPVGNGAFITYAQANAGLRFTPDPNVNGTASFQVQASTSASDAGLGGAVRTATITVNAINDPPVHVGPTTVVAPAVEDTAFPFAGDFSFFINDPDAGAGTLSTTLTATHGTLTVTPAANVTITGNGTTEVSLSGSLDDLNAALGGLTFAPDADYFGAANIHVVTTDNGNTGGPAKTDSDDFAIDVQAVNDAPVAADDTKSTLRDTPLAGAVSATDVENDTLTFHVVTPPAHGTLDLTAATGAYTYTPAAGYFGLDSFTFVANDGTADGNVATVSITVIRPNTAPVAQDGTLTAVEDVPSDGTLSATDADGDPLIFTVVTPPAHGTVQITGPATGAYTYTPAGDYNGPDSFTFKVNDGTVDSNTATVSVTVTAVNDAPVASDGSLTTAEDSAKGGTLSATDADGDGLTYAVATPPTHGTVQITDAATGAFTYTPAADYNGADSFTFKANDGTTDGTAATVSVTVTPVNDAPVFVAPGSAFTLALDTPNGTAVGAPLTATDVDGDAVTFALTGDAGGGGFQIDAATGQLSVRDTTLVTGGSYTLAVEVRDPSNATDSGTVTVVTNLRPVLDTAGTPMLLNQPLPVGKTPYTFAGTAVAGLLGFASDPDAGALRGIAITGVDAVNGTWEFNTEFGSPSASWQPITNVSDANALLLAADADTRVRFRPNPGFKPTFLGLSFKAWDQSDGAAEGPPLADTRDVRPGSPFSAATDTAWVAIGKVAPVVDPDGATVLPVPLPVYKATSKVVPLKVVKAQDLLGIAGLEVGETVATLKKASHGVAITGADRADGTWQYSATGKATDWHEVPADVSATNALLLGPTYKLRFAPTDRTADGAAPLTFLAWSPAADATLHAGDTNVDTTTHAAAFGADAGTAVLDLVPRLDLSKPAILNPVDAGDPTNAVALADLLDPFRVVGDNVGAAVVGATGPGTWHYSTDGGTTWPAFPVKPAVSVGQAVLLPLDALVRFEAANDTAGKKPLAPATAKLSVKAWDMTVASAGQRVAARGPAFSTETEVVTAAFRNTPPTLAAATPTLKPVSASAKPGTGFAVSTLLAGGVYSDADRPATPRGVAVTALTGTGGKWQYSLGGNVWVDFGAVDDTTAVLLAAGNRIRFLVTDPAAAVAGSPATLSFRAWDQSAGRAGDIGVDTTLAGGLTSFSATADTTTLEVVA